ENGTTVFLTTHYIDEAENVDKLCMIQQGRIVFSGAPAELKKSLEGESASAELTLEDAYVGLLTKGGRASEGRR
ncbi:MAG: ABC transporter, partial [Treponema sp.]|nr:ABC transporter [Treponema sp.]